MTLQEIPVGAVVEIPAVAVPETLLAKPEAFGGQPVDGCRVGTLRLKNGMAVGMRGDAVARRRLVLPRLVETHVHLDKCHTIVRCPDAGGDLAAAAAAQRRDKVHWTQGDLEKRMRRGLDELIAAGCGAIRTHIDWDAGDTRVPLAWEVAVALVAEAEARGVVLQPAALVGIDEMADPDRAESVARRVAEDGGVLGGFVLKHAYRRDGIRQLFALSDRFGLALDFHVDEGLDPALDGLDLIVETAREMRHEGPVLCGHTCSLASKPEEDVVRTADGLAETGIAVVTLPATNLYLQGRRAGTPRERGITRVRELLARGVDVVVGTDNVRDAFCPIGLHDPRHSLSLAVLAAHLDPPLADHLPMITTAASKALGLSPISVDTASVKDLLIADVPDVASLLAGTPAFTPLADHLNGDTAHG